MAKQPTRRRAKGEGTLIPLSRGRWKAVLTVKLPSGKTSRPSRTGKSRAEAAAHLTDLKNEHGSGSIEPSKQTVGEALVQWLNDAVKPHKSANTHDSYKRACDVHLIPRIGSKLLTKFRATDVQTLVADMARDEIGARTRQNAFAVLRRAMQNAVDLDKLKTNPCARIARPSHRRKDINPFTIAESKLIQTSTAGSRLHAVYSLALALGLRQGELFGLEWSAIDFKLAKINIARQAIEISGNVTFAVPKTACSIRELDIPPHCLAALKEHRLIMLREGHAGGLVFVAKEGGPIHKGNFRVRHWKPLLKRLKIAYRGFHQTRHTAATLALGAGISVHVVAKMLGHAKASTTLDIYAKALEQQSAAASVAISAIYR